ncbi:hypothetical protein L249_0882 [Ophiocordyceps polyrhachis-furcata BCC 54312]|uniref:GH16 domain-containing protein n=1 Tax=Ophiocordyceps polyrhachis-furcata BCC 54312 TaxID=1330021 RepID=A0A367LCF1_9HYPO|nr:hypothetical protein L249_0882 [Ophiocordyceps polyrhachis-furcata BCC 54312]
MASRYRSLTRSPSPPPPDVRSSGRRRRVDSPSPARSPTPPPRRPRAASRSWSRGRARNSRDASEILPPTGTKIVVERLSKNVREAHLSEIFGHYGPIQDLDLPINRTFGTNRGTAYILYEHREDAEEAIANMHEGLIDGTTVNVSIVLPRRIFSPEPPLARRGANIDPRFSGSGTRGGRVHRGYAPAGGHRRHSSPGRYGPRPDAFALPSRSRSRSPYRSPPRHPRDPRGGGGPRRSLEDSYSSRSRSKSPLPRRASGRHGGDGFRRRRTASAGDVSNALQRRNSCESSLDGSKEIVPSIFRAANMGLDMTRSWTCASFMTYSARAGAANDSPLRPGTPNSDRLPPGPAFNDSPEVSRPASSSGGRFEPQRYFHSRRVRKGDAEKPWLVRREAKEKWVTILPILGIVVGLGLAALLVWDGIRSVIKHKYCPVLDDSFDGGGGLNADVWTKEVTVGGFGNGEFDQTTGGDENVMIQNGNLVIRATLQDADKMERDNVMDLLADGSCTSTERASCVAATNTTAGNVTVVPPTKSGRINSRRGARLRYGRVEVTAKLPEGDWLWPAIWMMPVRETYGPWPASGEMDLMESRGNNWTYAQGGNDVVSSALHWGPDPANDGWWKTNNKHRALHTTYSAGFNTFGLEWSQKYLFTYVNSRLLQVLYTNFDRPMWRRGGFPESGANGTRLADSWTGTGRDNTPFDHEFYLVINLAVGGTNGWFEDGKSGKPWLDRSASARKDFWNARAVWLPTWKQPQLEISRVLMMQQCDGDEEL